MHRTAVLITNGNIMSMLALAGWMRTHGAGIRKVYVTRRLPSCKSNLRGVWELLNHSGRAYTYLKVWTNRLFPRKLRGKGLPAGVGDFLRHLGLDTPVVELDSVNTDAVVGEVRDLAPDYLVSFSATQRFKDPLVETPRVAAVNVHYGALPAYAGLSPYFWHLHNREETFGVTLHRIIAKLDAGPIIEQDIQPIADERTCLGLCMRMASRVSPMLNRLFGGETSVEDARPQPAKGRTYFRHPTKTQVRAFQAAGCRMLDNTTKQAAVERVQQVAAGGSGAQRAS